MKSAFLAAAAALLIGCGGGNGDRATKDSEPEVVVDPATAGSVSGQVTYQGPEVRAIPIDMKSDPACADANKEPVYAQDVVVNANGTLRNALVFVKDGLPAGRFPIPATHPILDQSGCMYFPRVLGVMVGQEFEVRNGDGTTHNVHAAPHANREWNRSQINGAVPFRDSFAHREIAVPMKCNVHPWMKAWVAVLDHPYFAVTGEDGAFELRGLPPGEYTLEVWHEKLGTVDHQVTIEPKQAANVEFTMTGGGGA